MWNIQHTQNIQNQSDKENLPFPTISREIIYSPIGDYGTKYSKR